jgi:hypothetical protein
MSIRHATETQLALFQAGELGLVERLRVRWHVNSCEYCGNELAAFEEARAVFMHGANEVPQDLEWDQLSAEMAANIHLGVEAGECVRPQPVSRPAATPFQWSAIWRPGLAVASVVVVLYAGTWAVTKKLGSKATNEAGIVLEARPGSLEIRENGAAFSLVRASTASTAISVGTGGSLRARDIDEDTGQVTIYHVYAE